MTNMTKPKTPMLVRHPADGDKDPIFHDEMPLNYGMPFKAGRVQGMIYGGPFKQAKRGVRRLVTVKMAVEVDHPHDISIPTPDFSMPTVEAMTEGACKAIRALAEGNDIYVGCMGGIGRTGLFMGVMAKVCREYAVAEGKEHTDFYFDPVTFVREHYYSHAIERPAQEKFVREFNTGPMLALLRELNGGDKDDQLSLTDEQLDRIMRPTIKMLEGMVEEVRKVAEQTRNMQKDTVDAMAAQRKTMADMLAQIGENSMVQQRRYMDLSNLVSYSDAPRPTKRQRARKPVKTGVFAKLRRTITKIERWIDKSKSYKNAPRTSTGEQE